MKMNDNNINHIKCKFSSSFFFFLFLSFLNSVWKSRSGDWFVYLVFLFKFCLGACIESVLMKSCVSFLFNK